MRVVGYFHIDGFYLRALENAPSVAVIHRDRTVLDVSVEARKRGLSTVMKLSEAKAILAGDGHFQEWKEEDFRHAQKEWIELATDFTDALEPADQHAAFLDFSEHPRPHEIAGRLAERLEETFKVKVRFAVADSRWIARQAALRGESGTSPLLLPKRFASALPIQAMPLPGAVLDRLTLLGYPLVGDVAKLPVETLRAQFGELAFEIKRMSMGSGDAHVDAVFPENSLADRWCFEAPPETQQGLDAGIATLAARLGNILRHEDAATKTVELFLEYEKDAPEVRRRIFSKAVTGAATLLTGLRLMLTQFPEQPVEAVRVRLVNVERSKRVQLGLDGERSRKDQQRSMQAAVANARTAFGDTAVVLGSDIAEPRWKQVRRAYSAANGWAWG